MINTVSANELKKCPDNAVLIDVRTPAEFREVHVTFAKNYPLDQLNPDQIREMRNGQSDQPLYVICKSGSRGKMACEKLVKAGLENIVNIEGGTEAAVAAGLNVVRGKKTISLDRQVRICAGSLVFLGTALAVGLENQYFLIIPAFIGAGLVFAGITDTCGMGMMISKMPWNQVKEETSCSVK